MTSKTLLAALIALGAASPADAAEKPGYSMEDVRACAEDAMRICRDKMPEIDAIESCMRANYEQLRPACKARFDKDH